MANDLEPLTRWFHADSWPLPPCPKCLSGRLQDLTSQDTESTESKRERSSGRSDPAYAEGTFTGFVTCSRPQCAEIVSVLGQWTREFDVREDDVQGDYYIFYKVRYAYPPLPLTAALPNRTPDGVRNRIRQAAEVVWADPGAAANRLRLAVEDLLTELKVPRYRTGKGRRTRVDLHARIQLLKNGAVAETLMAVKWIGNQGTHEDTLTAQDVLDGANLLERALEQLYDPDREDLLKRVQRINRYKGVSRAGRKR